MKTSEVIQLIREEFEKELIKMNSLPSRKDIMTAHDKATIKVLVRTYSSSQTNFGSNSNK